MNKNKINILLTPGPTPVPPEALEIMSRPIFHHRTPQFKTILKHLFEDLKYAFRTKEDVLTLCASGTGAMESSILNFFSPGDEVIVVNAGKFGERWVKLAEVYGLKADVINVTWGEAINPEEIKKRLNGADGKNIKGVFTTLCETSTAVLTDIKSIASFTQNSNALLVVDAISALGGEELETDAWGVDIVICGSQKALMIPPGLAYITANQRAWQRAHESKFSKFYFDLKKYKKSLIDEDVPFTPAISLILAQVEALRIFKKEGYENVIARSKKQAEQTRNAAGELGLKSFAKNPSNVLTAIELPQTVDGGKLVKLMRDELGVTVAGGQDKLKGKVIRIAHMGFITTEDLKKGFEIFAEALKRQGYACDAGKAIQVFNK